ncbi:MAG: hypothetical protein ABSH22_07775 [Tepidisphaeraceae bacterium]
MVNPLQGIVTAIFALSLVLVHATALGGAFLRATRWVVRDGWTFTALLLGEGLALFGAEIFLLGEARILDRAVIYLSTAIMLGLIALLRPWELVAIESEDRAAILPGRIRRTIMWVSAGAVFAAVVGACPQPTQDIDEIVYHWAAPLLWADSHGWVNSPSLLTNGPALAEMICTVPAMYGSSTAAHLLNVVFLLLFCASCASLALAVGAPPLAGVLGVLSLPVLLYKAPDTRNDSLAAAFALCAYAALFNASPKPPSGRAVVAATIALAAAVSTKPFLALAAPGVCAYIIYTGFRRDAGRSMRKRAIARCCGLGTVLVLTLLVWSAHCYQLSGRLWDTRGYDRIAQSPADPLWNSPGAVGRRARLVDYLVTPIVLPVQMTLGRQHYNEAYGERIGPLLLVFFPLGIFALRKWPPDRRVVVYFLLGSAAFYLWVFSPTFPKTRYNLFEWGIGCVVAAAGYAFTQRQRPWIAYSAFAVFMLVFAFGALDACRNFYSFTQFLVAL